jgi:hypothetical protein
MLHGDAVRAGEIDPALPKWQHLTACRRAAAKKHRERAEHLAYTFPDLNSEQLARRLYGGEMRVGKPPTTEEEEAPTTDSHENVPDIIKQARSNLHGGTE